MRGKAATEPEDDQTAGITPAYAGKSYGITEVYDNKKGSPPPMRGKGYVWRLKGTFSRITPAYAGKSSRSVGTKSISKDHPRLCGEKLIGIILGLVRKGSPPPMRGKGVDCLYAALRVRITPAYAGKRSPRKELGGMS